MAGTVDFYIYKGLHYIFRTKIINNFKAFVIYITIIYTIYPRTIDLLVFRLLFLNLGTLNKTNYFPIEAELSSFD